MVNKVRPIDANALIARTDLHINIGAGDNICIDIADIAKAPTIDPETLRPKGRWVSNRYKITCSSCNHSVFLGTKDPVCHKAEKENFKFCPNCGARMEGRR